MAADGSIIIDTEIDNKKAQQELNRLNRKIQTLNDQIYVKQKQKIPLVEQAQQLGAELDAAKAKLNEMQTGGRFYTSAHIQEQADTVNQLQKEWDAVNNKIDQMDAGIQKSTIQLDLAKEQAGAIQQQMAAAGPSSERMAKAMERMQKSANRFSLRLREVVRSALVFTVISQGLASLRNWLGRVIQTNSEATSAIARLKGALLTLAQPLLNVVIPAFVTFVNILTKIITVIAQLVSMLFGTTIEQSAAAAEGLNEQADALEGVGSAAKIAGKSLASFDTINKLSSSSGASGGGGASTSIEPDFSLDGILSEDQLNNILGLIKAIAAGLLAWKLSDNLLSGIRTFLGLLVAIDGAIRLVTNMFDAWANGMNESNLTGMLLGIAELVAGLTLAFGPLGGAIGAVVGGLALLVTSFHDAMENGLNLYNTLGMIAGLLIGGLGITALTGSFIPLLIAGLASILLAITSTFGDGQALVEGFQEILTGLMNFVIGIFTGNLTLVFQGINQMFYGLQTVVTTVLDAIRNMILSLIDWIDEQTGGRLTAILDVVRNTVNNCFETLKNLATSLIESLKLIFQGIIEFLTGVFAGDWDRAFRGLGNILIAIVNSWISAFESFVNFIIDGINTLVDAANHLLSILGIGTKIPQVPPLVLGRIPALAQGAVIPPNREFLAVLGDQKSGTNIETPLDTMVQAFKTALSDMGYGGNQTVVLELDGDQLGKVVYRLNKAETRRVGVNLAGV